MTEQKCVNPYRWRGTLQHDGAGAGAQRDLPVLTDLVRSLSDTRAGPSRHSPLHGLVQGHPGLHNVTAGLDKS